MEKFNELNLNVKKNVETSLNREYSKSLKDPEFKKLVTNLKVKDNIAKKYTSKLERTVKELSNCKDCKCLGSCQNKCKGMVYYPQLINDELVFNYIACKYKQKDIKEKSEIKSSFYEMPYAIKIARMKDIDVTNNRKNIIKWVTKFYSEYKKDNKQKGLYLDGSFGSGKTFIISSLLNELSKDNYKSVIVYYPELLRSLKESFQSEDYNDRINEIKYADLLLLDDIGAETVSTWNRDEILGTILQYRMDNKMPTFFTSNLSLTELENHFIIKDNEEEKIKSRRIMERIKYLTDELSLVGENRRK